MDMRLSLLAGRAGRVPAFNTVMNSAISQHNKEREELHRLQEKHPQLAAKMVRPRFKQCSARNLPAFISSYF